MKAIILAAGISSRLRPITDLIPKSLIEVGGKSLLLRNIENLIKLGIEDITVVVGYLKEKIIDSFNNKFKTIKFIENPIFNSSGSGYSLYLGMKENISNKPLVFMDADIIFYPEIIKDIHSEPDKSFVYVGNSPCDEEAVKVFVDENNMVTGISKVALQNTLCIGESIGIIKLAVGEQEKLLNFMEEKIKKGNYDFEWEHVLHENTGYLFLYPRVSSLPWIEIDFYEDVIRAEDIVKSLP